MAKGSVAAAEEKVASLDAASVRACIAEIGKEPAANGWEANLLVRLAARLEALIG